MPVAEDYGVADPRLAAPAALMADRARAAMLTALLGGYPLAAGELARLAGVQPSTASTHLARLLDGGLVSVTSQGRRRYYALAGPDVAAAIEALSHLAPAPPVRGLRQSRQAAALADARTCYDHLAGRAGVALLDALLAGRLLAVVHGPSGGPPSACPAVFEVTAAGSAALGSFGLDIGQVRQGRRRFAVSCLDWTERRAHLAGALAAAITGRLLELGSIERAPVRRAVRVTEAGQDGLAATFGWAPSPAG